MSAKKILITGITGQDGVYLAKFLLDKGYAVSGLLSDGHTHSVERLRPFGFADRVQLLPCRLTDINDVRRVLDKVQPDEIYNLAAISSVGASFEKPFESVQFNVLSIAALLEAVRLSGRKTKIYQASSSEMFGNAAVLPADEKTLLNPISPYAVSKTAGHMLVKNYRTAYKMFCCCGILFNHESVLRPAHFVTKKILSTAVRISRGSPEKLRLGNTSIKRDWGYAPEYVKAMWLMLQQSEPDDYVIASGEARSLQEFVEAVFSRLGLDWKEHVETDQTLYRPSDIHVTWGNASKAGKVLGWTYAMSFDQLVAALVRDEQGKA